MESKNNVYLDSNLLQKDMRIRIPKQVLQNLNATAGETYFDIYINPETNSLILTKSNKQSKGEIKWEQCY